jgi:hypothetical protein
MSNALSNMWTKITSNEMFSSLYTTPASAATGEDSSTAIEDKKDEQNSASPPPDFDAFKKAVVSNFRSIIYIIVVGAMGVYLGKVAQANILPDNIDYSPYTDKTRGVEEKEINVNVVKISSLFGGGTPEVLCTKILFPTDKDDDHSIIKKMATSFIFSRLEKANKPDTETSKTADAFKKYISDVLINVYPYNFLLINSLFGAMNQNLSESAIYILFPLFFGTLFFSLFFMMNMILVVINLFFYLGDFFQVYNGTEWGTADDDDEGYSWWTRLLILLLFFFLGFGICMGVLPLVTMITSLSMALSLKANIIKGDNIVEDEKFGFISALLSSILYKGQLLMALFSFDMIIDSFTYLNNNYGVGCLIAILFLYFVSTLFKQYVPTTGEDSIVSPCNLKPDTYEQATASDAPTSLFGKTADWTKGKFKSAKNMMRRSTTGGGVYGQELDTPVEGDEFDNMPPLIDRRNPIPPVEGNGPPPLIDTRNTSTPVGDSNIPLDMHGGRKKPNRKGFSKKTVRK